MYTKDTNLEIVNYLQVLFTNWLDINTAVNRLNTKTQFKKCYHTLFCTASSDIDNYFLEIQMTCHRYILNFSEAKI